MSDIRNQLWIANAWVDAQEGDPFPTTNPATGDVITQVAEGRAADIDRGGAG